MARKRKLHEDDDGRVVASMNVDGMPWYAERMQNDQTLDNDLSDLSKGETWEIIIGTTKAALLVLIAFLVSFQLFILFCVLVWFR
jgi:hypothetical protein